MSYLVLARKWRPQTFSEVVGQEHIVTTLGNAIKLDRVAHAYLFSGPRGVGKTTLARLLAKGINCDKGPTTEPCGECESCLGVTAGADMDVIEIDGASNRGINEIRDLREKVRYSSVRGRYRVYVIDEVHMLTTEAFNALLKTLEEPPQKVIFIMATTSPSKVPATITSRLQHFAFHRLPLAQITDRLSYIAAQDGLELTPDALTAIATEAGGSLRDALSLLDQVVASDSHDEEAVRSLLGQISPQVIAQFVDAILLGDNPVILQSIAQLYASGADLEQVHKQLSERLRNLLVANLVEDAGSIMELPQEQLERLTEGAKQYDKDHLMLVYRVIVEQGKEHLRSMPPRAALELTCLQGARVQGLIRLDDLVQILKKSPTTTTTSAPSKRTLASVASNPSEEPVPAVAPSSVPPPIKEAVTPPKSDGLAAMFDDMDGLPDNDYGKLIKVLEDEGQMPLAMAVRACSLSPLVSGMMQLELLEDNNYLLTLLEDSKNKRFLEDKLGEILKEKVQLAVSRKSDDEIQPVATTGTQDSGDLLTERVIDGFDGEEIS